MCKLRSRYAWAGTRGNTGIRVTGAHNRRCGRLLCAGLQHCCCWGKQVVPVLHSWRHWSLLRAHARREKDSNCLSRGHFERNQGDCGSGGFGLILMVWVPDLQKGQTRDYDGTDWAGLSGIQWRTVSPTNFGNQLILGIGKVCVSNQGAGSREERCAFLITFLHWFSFAFASALRVALPVTLSFGVLSSTVSLWIVLWGGVSGSGSFCGLRLLHHEVNRGHLCFVGYWFCSSFCICCQPKQMSCQSGVLY